MPKRKRFKLPIHRERRQIQPKQQVMSNQFNCKWTLADKKKLLRALKTCGVDDISKIHQDFLPHRTSQEINHFLKRMKVKSYYQPVLEKEKVPIELWVDMAENLMSGVTDCSTVLAEVLMKMENEEVHDQARSAGDPNWHSIYSYLVMQLRGEEVPDLEPIEAGIVLDLLNSVASHLRSLDISQQQLLMARKYAMLSARVECSDKAKAFNMARKALEEDLLAPVQSNAAAGSQNAAASSTEVTSSTSGTSEVDATSRGSTASNSTNCQPGNGEGCKSETTEIALENCVLKSRQSPLFAINPFCIPIKYLNPKRLPPEPTQTSQPQALASNSKST